MALLNQKAFERKLQNMSSTQDSVQTVSLWMIHHKKHAEDMVSVWLEQLKKASKADRRLVLFYLANDVLQNSRKKGKEFSNAFTKILRDAIQLLSDKTIKGSVQRVIKIWEERRLFEKDYLEALRSRLDSGDVPVISKKPKEKPVQRVEKEKEKEVKPVKQKRLPPADFKPSKLIDALKALRNFEGELTLKESQLNSLRIDASDLETVRQLKDRTGGGKFCEEYELATTKLEEFSEMLRREQQERLDMIKVLEDGEAFYDTSYGEVKVIVHAYKTFGSRLTSLKKKVDAKVNKLAQKAAEKAKTGPVSAPQASFLTSGLPDVGEGSASSTPSEAQPEADDSPEEDKPIDPTVDNIEVADMDIEDDSGSEKSETSEEASVEDPKSSNDQTPNSSESSESQAVQSTPQEDEIPPVISVAVSATPAQPLTPNVGVMMPVQGSMLPNQPPIAAPQPAVRMVVRPYMGVQGIGFPGSAPQFRPGVPRMQPIPGMAQNPLLQPSGVLPGRGQIPIQGQPFSQMPRQAGLLPNANVPITGGVGTLQPFPAGGGFVRSQAPLPVVATTVPAPIQMTPNSIPTSQTSQGSGGLPQGIANVGSPDSEASAPSPVGSPELHLEEGDETPETTPAPLGDVDVNDKTGFETNESFLGNPVKTPTSSLGLGFSGTPSAAKAISESPSSSNSTPSTSDQFGGQQQDAAFVKKDNGQKVTAVDILAQLLSRGRKLKETTEPDVRSSQMPVNPPVPAAVAAPEASSENSGKPQSKPLITLIDSLFPKLSDSIKTLKEKEKAVNPAEAHCNSPSTPVVDTPSSLPARPLPIEGQFPGPSGVVREPPFQQTGLKSILKKGPKRDEEKEFGSNCADVQAAHHQGPERASMSSNFPEQIPMGMPVELRPEARDDARDRELQQLEQQGVQIVANEDAPFPSSTSHPARPGSHFQIPPVRGSLPHFPQERLFNRPPEMLPHRPPPFGPRGPFQGPRGPPFDQSRGNTGPPFGEAPPDMPGPAHIYAPRGPPFERRAEGPPDMPGEPPHGLPDMPEQGHPHGPLPVHSPRGPPFERRPEGPPGMPVQLPHGHSPIGPPEMPERLPPHGPPRVQSPRGAPFERRPEGPPDMPGRVSIDQPPHGNSQRGPPHLTEHIPPHGPPHIHSPRGPPFDGRPEGPPDVPIDQPPHGHSQRGPPYDEAPEIPEKVPPHRPPHNHFPRGPPGDMPERAVPDQSPHGHSPRDGPPQRPSDASNVHRRSTEDAVPTHGGPNKPSDVPVEEKQSNKDEDSYVNGPPGVRRHSSDGASRGPLHRPDVRQPPHEQVPRSDGPPPHRASFPGAMDDVDRRREFEHWEEYGRERYRDPVRGPWDFPYDHPGPPPPDWRAPPLSPRGDPNRSDFREDDPSMWTSFESPGKSPGRHMDFPSRTRGGFRGGPPEFDRFRDYGPPERRRHSAGDFEGDWMRYPGPLKRPGPPPVPFPGPSKRPYY